MTHSNNRDFTAPYVFQEFPKWVKLVDGSKVLVHSAEEEQILIGPAGAAPQGAPGDQDPTAEALEAERQALLAKAKDLGLTVHPATGADKLRAKIEAAGAASQE